MFDNIGGKIKTVAKVFCWIGIIASIMLGVMLPFTAEVVFAIIIVGCLGSWVGSFVLYGFGELIETVSILSDALLEEVDEEE